MTEPKKKTFNAIDQDKQLGRQLFYRFVRNSSRLGAVVLFGFRAEGRYNLDAKGGGILLSTHQSMLDPVLVGMIANRRLNYLARKTLFNNRLFGFIIGLLDAIEIDRDRSGLAGLREMLKRLQRGEMVLLFPEGTRTTDGFLGELKPGFIPVARRSQVPLYPIAIVGAYDCLPRGTKLPTRKPIAVVVGEPIPFETYQAWNDAELLVELRKTLLTLHNRAKELVAN
jgi:1-acyl-sn-glycerol-3-phosphate acyltransferase